MILIFHNVEEGSYASQDYRDKNRILRNTNKREHTDYIKMSRRFSYICNIFAIFVNYLHLQVISRN